MGIDHVFHRVSYQIARWQRVKHSVVAHGYSVVDGDGIEFSREASELFYLLLYGLTYFVKMRVPRDKLCE